MWKNGDMFMADWDSILYEASHSRLYTGKRDIARFLGSAFIHLEVIWKKKFETLYLSLSSRSVNVAS